MLADLAVIGKAAGTGGVPPRKLFSGPAVGPQSPVSRTDQTDEVRSGPAHAVPNGTAKIPDQPPRGARHGCADYYFPESYDKPDRKYDAKQTETARTVPTAGASSAAMSAMNGNVFPRSRIDMSYTHDQPPKRCSCSNGGADGNRTRKQF